MTIIAIQVQVNLFCTDVDACLTFYTRLGLAEAFRAPESSPSTELVLWCEDTDTFYDRAMVAGATSVVAPMDSPDGRLHYAWVRDPDGHQVGRVAGVRSVRCRSGWHGGAVRSAGRSRPAGVCRGGAGSARKGQKRVHLASSVEDVASWPAQRVHVWRWDELRLAVGAQPDLPLAVMDQSMMGAAQ